MLCERCEQAVTGALCAVAGVTAVDVDLGSKLVRVEHDPERAAAEQMRAAVEGHGCQISACEAGS